MNLVIGSGPSGIACTYALLEKGEDVLVVDAGVRVEQEQQGLLDKIRSSNDAAALNGLKSMFRRQEVSAKGVALKLTYGSDFPYREARECLDLNMRDTGLLASLATGGLSNTWGAAALPYLQHDIPDWPITAQDLAPHYEKVIQFTGLSATRDDLADLFPFYTSTPHNLTPSSQGGRLLRDLGKIRSSLKENGISHGSSRLMVGPSRNSNQACVYCGQCIYGCPYGCIYNSGDDLMSLLRQGHPRLKYQSNTVVTTLREKGDVVTIDGFDRISKAPLQLEATRVFLGAGVIPSTRIMLKSMGAYDQPVELKDSQYFLFPLLSLKGAREMLEEATYTLSQLFVEIQDETLSPYTVHLQLYTYNDIITKTLEQKFRFLPWLNQPLIRLLQHRIIIVQGYLHSQHSGKVRLNLTRNPATAREQFNVEEMINPETHGMVRKVINKISKPFSKVGLFPISAALNVCNPGRGFHTGGSFPMKTNPGPFESDIYGRVGGSSRIHLVDASLFPTIPATTITLTAMANAHRIGAANY